MAGGYDRSALDALPETQTAPFDGKRVALLLVGGVAAMLLVAWIVDGLSRPLGRGPELIAPLHRDLQTAAIFIGTFLGLLTAALVCKVWLLLRDKDDEDDSLLDLVFQMATALLLCVTGATWCARSLAQEAAFAGVHPTSFPVAFTVVGTGEDDDGGAWLRLRFGEGGREFGYAIDPALKAEARVGDTVQLRVETGRWQVQRTVPGPRLSPVDLHHHG